MAGLNNIAPNWADLSDEELSKVLVSQGVTTATGKRFSPERVKEFRRAVTKAAADNNYHSFADDAGTADAIRRRLLAIITELKAPVSAERHAELTFDMTTCAVILCEDRFANQTLLWRAVDVADKSLARQAPRQAKRADV